MIGGMKLRSNVTCERCKRRITNRRRGVRYRGRPWHFDCYRDYRQIFPTENEWVRSPWQQDRLDVGV